MKRFAILAASTLLAASAMADNASVWGGYYDGESTRTCLGTKSKVTYNQASYFGGGLVGQTIDSVKIYFRSVTCIKDLKLWVSTTLPSSADAADVCCVSISRGSVVAGDPSDNVGTANVIGLETPYTISTEGVYVGYSFTVTSTGTNAGQYPTVIASNKMEKGLYLKTGSNSWTDYGSEYGVLAMQLQLSGEKPVNAVTPADFGQVIAGLGEIVDVDLQLLNLGSAGINSIDYTVTTDGVASEEQHLSLVPSYHLYAGVTTVSISIPADEVQGSKAKTVTITKVNGQPNESSDKEAEGTMNTIKETFVHRVAVEEFTGTGCGWCPRGLVGMQKLRKTFGDRFVGIGLHQYNATDPMYIAVNSYASIGFSGAPSCAIERGDIIDPYYGSSNDICDDFRSAMNSRAEVGVEVTGTWNADSSKVDAKATVKSMVAGNDYNIEFVLIGDSVCGTTSSWKQHNYYCQYTSSQLPEDLAQFGSGGENGGSTFAWAFDDVALSSSYVSGKNTAESINIPESYTPVESACTVAMPTKATLLAGVDYDKVYVIALVINPTTKKIINAAKAKVIGSEPAGIQQVNADSEAADIHLFDLQGRQVVAPRKGQLFIQNGKKFIIR